MQINPKNSNKVWEKPPYAAQGGVSCLSLVVQQFKKKTVEFCVTWFRSSWKPRISQTPNLKPTSLLHLGTPSYISSAHSPPLPPSSLPCDLPSVAERPDCNPIWPDITLQLAERFEGSCMEARRTNGGGVKERCSTRAVELTPQSSHTAEGAYLAHVGSNWKWI